MGVAAMDDSEPPSMRRWGARTMVDEIIEARSAKAKRRVQDREAKLAEAKRHAEALAALLKDEDNDTRLAAVTALAMLADEMERKEEGDDVSIAEPYASELSEALSAPLGEVRFKAAEALSKALPSERMREDSRGPGARMTGTNGEV